MKLPSMKSICKRAFDISTAVVGIALEQYFIRKYGKAIMQETGEDLYFYQDRVGLDGKIFKIKKLQTMSQARDADGELLPEDQRLGPVGEKLRRRGVDELSNFWNVLKGDMSTIGPRPYQPTDIFIALDKERYQVKPGISSRTKLKLGNAPHTLANMWDIVEVRKSKERGALKTLKNDFTVCIQTLRYMRKGHDAPSTHYICPHQKKNNSEVTP